MNTDWEIIARAAEQGLVQCAEALRQVYPSLLIRPFVSENDFFPARVSVALSAFGERQVEHLVLYIGFHRNEASELDASADVTQGDCPFFKFGPESSTGGDETRLLPWALAHVAQSLEFFWDALPEIEAALAQCLRDESTAS